MLQAASNVIGQPRTWDLPTLELPETAVVTRPEHDFGRPFDAWLPKPIQLAWAAVDGTIRAGVDLLVPARGPSAQAAAMDAPLDRAREAQRALVEELAVFGKQDSFRSDHFPVWRTEAWPLGQVLHGRVLLAMQGGDWDRVDGVFREFEAYRSGDGFVGGVGTSERYYDDNAWIGLAAVQAFSATGDEKYLAHAERTFRQVQSGEHPDGGLYWFEQDKSGRHTCSVAPAAQLAMGLYEATGSERYLEFAKEQAAWLNTHLRLENHLYGDNLKNNGKVDPTLYSYNQGTPIGLDVQLYRATGEQRYLARAQQTADAALEHFSGDRLWKQPPAFNAIFFRNLLALEAVSPQPRYLQAVDAYLDRAWDEGRSPKTGLFNDGGIGHYGDRPGTALDQGGLSQLYAARALPRSERATLT